MNVELEQRLVDQFPALFPDGAHCECEDGWYDLIERACRSIVACSPPAGLTVGRVKEKFGELRIDIELAGELLWNNLPENVYKEVCYTLEWAELKSRLVCETCGSTEGVGLTVIPPGNYWVKTLCRGCHENCKQKN